MNTNIDIIKYMENIICRSTDNEAGFLFERITYE